MELLLDTHVFIWYAENDKSLPKSTKEKIKALDNDILISIVSLWEIGIKTSLKKLTLNGSMADIINLTFENGFKILPLQPDHIIKNNLLEFYHRDPFDRMIIAQALVEDLEIISKDEAFDKYHVRRIWE